MVAEGDEVRGETPFHYDLEHTHTHTALLLLTELHNLKAKIVNGGIFGDLNGCLQDSTDKAFREQVAIC